MKRILITAPNMQKDYLKLKGYFKKYQVDLPHVNERLSEKELMPIIDQYDGVICGDDEFTPKVIDKAKKLKIIVKWGTGTDSINISYANSKNIKVCNSPDAFTQPVSDTVIGAILYFARTLGKSDKLLKIGKWEKVLGFSLSEKSLGIIGMGNIGRAVAKKAKAMGMTVLGYDVKKVDTDIKMVDKKTLLKKSDFVSLNCSLNPTSFHMISLKELKLMKGGIIINTARGPIIKEEDLIKALERGIISGAALDVFEKEPLPKNSKLRKFDNIILSAHNSNSSPKYYQNVHLNSIKHLISVLG